MEVYIQDTLKTLMHVLKKHSRSQIYEVRVPVHLVYQEMYETKSEALNVNMKLKLIPDKRNCD